METFDHDDDDDEIFILINDRHTCNQISNGQKSVK